VGLVKFSKHGTLCSMLLLRNDAALERCTEGLLIRTRRLFLLTVFCGVAQAQLLHPSSPMPSFAVTTVRPTSPSHDLEGGGTNADSYRTVRATIKDVIAYAFGVGYDHEILNAPSWMLKDHFDILGKLDAEQVVEVKLSGRDEREAQMRLMVQSMLAERFHLKYHFETREMPVYTLEIAKGGFKCPVDTASEPVIPDMSRPHFRWSAMPAPPPPPPDWQPPSPTERKLLMQTLHMRTRGWPFWLLFASLSHQPELEGRPVIDKTELDGSYDCDLHWSQADSDGTDQPLFAAMHDQLGLTFQPSKGPVEVLAIDSISRPSEN
jgi:uncharacterized protein (TIGR03435 family)